MATIIVTVFLQYNAVVTSEARMVGHVIVIQMKQKSQDLNIAIYVGYQAKSSKCSKSTSTSYD